MWSFTPNLASASLLNFDSRTSRHSWFLSEGPDSDSFNKAIIRVSAPLIGEGLLGAFSASSAVSGSACYFFFPSGAQDLIKARDLVSSHPDPRGCEPFMLLSK